MGYWIHGRYKTRTEYPDGDVDWGEDSFEESFDTLDEAFVRYRELDAKCPGEYWFNLSLNKD